MINFVCRFGKFASCNKIDAGLHHVTISFNDNLSDISKCKLGDYYTVCSTAAISDKQKEEIRQYIQWYHMKEKGVTVSEVCPNLAFLYLCFGLVIVWLIALLGYIFSWHSFYVFTFQILFASLITYCYHLKVLELSPSKVPPNVDKVLWRFYYKKELIQKEILPLKTYKDEMILYTGFAVLLITFSFYTSSLIKNNKFSSIKNTQSVQQKSKGSIVN